MQELKYRVMLFITAFIWGTAFVGQRIGIEHIGPFTFTAVRFFVGALSLLPLLYVMSVIRKRQPVQFTGTKRDLYKSGILCGLLMFCGISFQQTGIMYTTAGKAGFITSLYIVLVPIFGIFLRQRVGRNVWFGVVLALFGLYLLTIKDGFAIEKGDLIVLGGTFFWAIHILVIDYYAPKIDGLKMSFMQFVIASGLSLIVALVFETITWVGIEAAMIPILYTGIIVVGIGFTLQIFGQSGVDPSMAAIMLSLESVFAVLAGMAILGESMTMKEVIGCVVMFVAVILTQLPSRASEDVSGATKKVETV